MLRGSQDGGWGQGATEGCQKPVVERWSEIHSEPVRETICPTKYMEMMK